MTTSDLVAPSSAAWLRYVADDGATRLAIARPDGSFVDCGPLDPIEALARDGLTGDALERLATSGKKMDAPTRFAPPVARPSKILCLGKNYAAHAAEFGHEVPEEPLFFTKLVDTLAPHGGTVQLPHWVDTRIDHEAELVVVLGFEGPPRKYVDASEAMDLVAGYSIFDDVTARRMQGDDRNAKHPWLRCKSFDTFGPFGPWVVPADALDPSDLAIELRVNGDLRQQSRTSLMVVGIADAIAYLSRHTTLRPGDLVVMGTPEGVGPLEDGDVVTVDIEGIGRLSHGVARETAPA